MYGYGRYRWGPPPPHRGGCGCGCGSKTYKIVETRKSHAEQLMNDMAAQGWQVVSVSYWSYWTIRLLITFVRES